MLCFDLPFDFWTDFLTLLISSAPVACSSFVKSVSILALFNESGLFLFLLPLLMLFSLLFASLLTEILVVLFAALLAALLATLLVLPFYVVLLGVFDFYLTFSELVSLPAFPLLLLICWSFTFDLVLIIFGLFSSSSTESLITFIGTSETFSWTSICFWSSGIV